MTQPIAINTALSTPPDTHSPAELSASSVSSIDWSISSSSAISELANSDDDNHDHSQRTPGKSTRPVSLAFADLSSATDALALTDDDDHTDSSPTTSPKRVRVLSGSTAPTSLLSDDKRETLESSDDECDGRAGSTRTMAASVPNTPAFRRADKKKENRPRAQTDAARRGSKQLNLGVLEGATADELASWINASPSPFEPSTPLTATALSAVGSVVDCLPSSSPSGDNETPRKLSYGFIPGPGVTQT